MKKNYKRNWLFKFKSALVLVSFLISGSAIAQLSGTYTIDKGSAASTTNFTSISSFATEINSKGVSGPVVVNVVKGSGPYSESQSFQYGVTFTVSGTSTNTITINGNGEKLTSGSYAAIRLNGADFITFDDLDVEATGTYATKCYLIGNNADSNTIKNSELTITRLTSTSSSSAYVMFSSSVYGRGTGNHGSGNVIMDNTMSNGSSTSAGPYYGVCDYRSSASRSDGNSVLRNTITDVYYYAFYYYYVDNTVTNGNTITQPRRGFRTFRMMYAYQSNNLTCNENYFHSVSATNGSIWGAYLGYCNGTSDNPTELKDNTFENLSVNYIYGEFLGFYINRTNYANLEDNELLDILASGPTYYNNWGFYIYYANYCNVKNNKIDNFSTPSSNLRGIDAYRANNFVSDGNLFNKISTVNGNSISMVNRYGKKANFVNNAITEQSGRRIWGITSEYSDSVTMAHNTVVNKSTSTNIYSYQFFQGNGGNEFVNNIAYNTGAQQTTGTNHDLVLINVPNSAMINNENNVFYTNQSSINYRSNNTIYTDFSTYLTAAGDKTSVFADPGFNNGYIPSNVLIANTGLPNYAKVDLTKTTRTECGPDIGAYEYFVDNSVSNLSSLPTSICGNVGVPVSIDVNNSSATDTIQVPVYFQVVGKSPVFEITDSIQPSGKVTHSFSNDIIFNKPGINTVEVGLACDDDESNNTLTGSINVISSPTGGTLTQGTTFDGYYEAGTELSPDVLGHSYTNDYEITRPTKYVASAPGADYTYTFTAYDQDSNDVTNAGFSYTALGESFTTTPEDSISGRTIDMSLVVSDVNTGCDTTISRMMYIPHVPDPSFNSSNICLGDVAQFKNTSTLEGSGYIITNWEFDDPDPSVTDDNSDIKDGFWKYSTYGNDIMVEMTVRNGVYPKFKYVDVDTINVTPKPLVDFKVLNACEGSPIVIKNSTTLPVSSTIDYSWDFGGEYTTTGKDPSYTFSTPGQRKISVTATANGCFASLTKNAYQFEMPMAEFTSEGECNFVNVDFINGSTIENGANMGYSWDFDGEGISREIDPSFAFAKSGTKSVTLTATSEFGCVNKFSKSIVLQESPEADFTWDAACNLTPINFTITGSLPDGGANSSFEWDFAGESSTVQADPSYLFSKVGPKMVKLTISDLNGCSSSIEKEVNVVLQAVADFEAGSVCEGEEAVFTNKSSVAAGDLTYEWTFGDGAGSSDLSPTHSYTDAKSYNVKLKAIVDGGCSDEVTYPVVVNPTPEATFTLAKDGRTVVCDGPAGNDIYRWTFGDGSKDDSEDPTYTFENVDRGTFTVCLATKKGECWNDECEDITINLAGIENLTQNDDMINVYPNPTNGKFNVTVENAGEVVVKVGDILGNVLDVNVTDNMNGTYSVDMSVVADGVYFVQVKNGDYFATKRITVSK
ncbi:PKD domain-containing protein [Bacteroidia bacterium]|nr:PKD domain-containing protein [Bacteroidia bacterium]